MVLTVLFIEDMLKRCGKGLMLVTGVSHTYRDSNHHSGLPFVLSDVTSILFFILIGTLDFQGEKY